MRNGHCRHCSPDCQGDMSVDMTWHMTVGALIRWHPLRQCPACAEAEEIATEIADLAHRCEVLEYGPEMLVRGMRKARAQVVARGEA